MMRKQKNKTMVGFDTCIERRYKGAEISVIVEDGLIDEAKVFVDNNLIEDLEISTTANPAGIEYTRKNLNFVLARCSAVVDNYFVETVEV